LGTIELVLDFQFLHFGIVEDDPGRRSRRDIAVASLDRFGSEEVTEILKLFKKL
jgi:hypothetical protein